MVRQQHIQVNGFNRAKTILFFLAELPDPVGIESNYLMSKSPS